jgi:hypothetical protein
MTITHDYDDDWDFVSKNKKDPDKTIEDGHDDRGTVED